jgi:hypothetical protein
MARAATRAFLFSARDVPRQLATRQAREAFRRGPFYFPRAMCHRARMKTIGLFLALSLVAGCKKGGSAASQCSDAISKGVDKMIALRKEKMEGSAMPPELKAKMEERAKKMDEVSGALKQAITNRCTEDKWPADVIKCYGDASSMEELRSCREKLPADQQTKLKAEEMQVMMKAMGGPGGMPAPHSMGGTPPNPPANPPAAGSGVEGGAMGGAGAPPTGSAAAGSAQ